jgi:HEAT repeat protein
VVGDPLGNMTERERVVWGMHGGRIVKDEPGRCGLDSPEKEASVPRDPDDSWDKDSRPLEQLIALALMDPDSEEARSALATLSYRGTRTEFDAAVRLARSAAPGERALGAEVLGRLGWDEKAYLDESLNVLLPMLEDPDVTVVKSAAYALGHRGDPRGAEPVARLRAHASDDIRAAVAYSLASLVLPAPEAVSTLVGLTTDRCAEVRDWATFGLRSEAEEGRLDTPAVRDALAARCRDDDAEVRGEALLGLASLRDARALPHLLVELRRPLENNLVVEAAGILADHSLSEPLRDAWNSMDSETQAWFDSHGFLRAYEACGGNAAELRF